MSDDFKLSPDKIGKIGLDHISIEKLKGVHPDLRALVFLAKKICKVDFRVIEGLRSAARQRALYNQGRKTSGKIVTWTLKSKHMKGLAVDIVIKVNGKATYKVPISAYYEVNAAMKLASDALKRPYRWLGPTKGDWGHFEI